MNYGFVFGGFPLGTRASQSVVSHTISLSHDKRLKIISLCRKYLSFKSLSLLQLQILAGNLNHAAAVIPGSSLRLQWCGRATSMALRYNRYTLSKYDKRQIYWWYGQLADENCMVRISDPMFRTVLNIWTDASDYYGGSLVSNGIWSSYVWSPRWARCSIFLKELVAFTVAVVTGDCPQGSLIRGFIDNSRQNSPIPRDP